MLWVFGGIDVSGMLCQPRLRVREETTIAPDACCECLESSMSPGCANSTECEDAVCAESDWCCIYEWEGYCTLKARTWCPFPDDTTTDDPIIFPGACCECLDASLHPGCDNLMCEYMVCTKDEWCCSEEWDEICVEVANDTT